LAVEATFLESPGPAYAETLAPRLRAADVAEVWAACGEEPLPAILKSLELSTYTRGLLLDGEPAAIWGVAPLRGLPGAGAAWLLGSDALTAHARTFWRLCRPELDRMLEVAPVLLNYVDARYRQALRWAERLGFSVEPARPFGFARMPFHRIVICRR
jgi:hypothetical protein